MTILDHIVRVGLWIASFAFVLWLVVLAAGPTVRGWDAAEKSCAPGEIVLLTSREVPICARVRPEELRRAGGER